MTLPVWGQLEKAQNNPQIIDDAITEAIVAHEQDPTAHLGSGESLEQHKTEKVIDHPALSILDDKFAYDRNLYNITFDSLTPFDHSTNIEVNGIDELYLHSASSTNLAYLSGYPGDMVSNLPFSYQLNPRLFTSIMLTQITSQLGYIIVGEMDEGRGFGFKIIDNTLYGFYYKPDFSEAVISLITLTAWKVYKIEAIVTYPTQIDFYVDNVLILTINNADLVPVMDYILNIPWIQFKSTTTNSRDLYIRGFHWEANLP